MTTALIGYTGFVGGNLLRQRCFDSLYNSQNVEDMRGRTFAEVVCAGVSAVKWKANLDPEGDRAAIQRLAGVLATIRAERFILISTVDVYPVLKDRDEFYDCHVLESHAYGRNRLEFEDFCRRVFPTCCTIRLPALFGHGLKKNVIFDLLNGNRLEQIHPASSFQYYGLDNLWSDIQSVLREGIALANFFTEPVATQEIVTRFFPGREIGRCPAPECHYDLHTRYARLRGKTGPYLYERQEVLQQLGEFIRSYGGP